MTITILPEFKRMIANPEFTAPKLYVVCDNGAVPTADLICICIATTPDPFIFTQDSWEVDVNFSGTVIEVRNSNPLFDMIQHECGIEFTPNRSTGLYVPTKAILDAIILFEQYEAL